MQPEKEYEMEQIFKLSKKLWELRGKQERYWQFLHNLEHEVAIILDVKAEVLHKAERLREGDTSVVLSPETIYDLYYVENFRTVHALNALITKEKSARLKG